jgi:hypothetical protein
MCCGVSEDRESIFTFQAPEPALAFASSRLTYQFGWSEILKQLQVACSSTYTDAGYRGELGAQILLLMAADRLAPKALGYELDWEFQRKKMIYETRIPLIPLIEYLKLFLGEEVCKDPKLIRQTKNMKIRLVQFVQLFCKPTIHHIIGMFERGAGIVCKFGAQYVDLILPVFIEIDGKLYPGVHNMTVVLIQIKCLEKGLGILKSADLASIKLERNLCTEGLDVSLDYVSIYIDLGNHKDSTSNLSSRSTTPSGTPVTTNIDFFGADTCRVKVENGDPHQLSFISEKLRPTNVLDPSNSEFRYIDSYFSGMMQARWNPLELKSEVLFKQISRECLEISLQSCYQDFIVHE